MGQKIYVITRGAYSDYEIIGATTNRARADEIRMMHSNTYQGDAVIEVFEDGVPSDWYTPHRILRVWLTEDASEHLIERYWDDARWVNPDNDMTQIKLHSEQEGKWRYEILIFGDCDDDHALKIAYDTRASYLAQVNCLD